MDLAQQLVGAFERMIRSDGGRLEILSAASDRIELAYAPGSDPECEDGACVLPHQELQDMMREWLSRRAPDATVNVRPMAAGN